MSIPPDALERGCAAKYPQPVGVADKQEAEFWNSTLCRINCQELDPPLHDIVYRSSSREEDIRHHVFRWDLTPYQEVFVNGIRARRRKGTHDADYVNLYNYVHHRGRPLDSRQDTSYVFISTTISSNWHPSVESGTDIIVFRYEIYAPGGIWVAQTLGDCYQYSSQDEVCFVEGIARQYIRSAQAFRLVREHDSRYTTMERSLGHTIIHNRYFNPQSHPQARIQILNPVTYYVDRETRQRQLLEVLYYPERERDNKEVSNDPVDDTITERDKREVSNDGTSERDKREVSIKDPVDDTTTERDKREVSNDANTGRDKREVSMNDPVDDDTTNWYAVDVANCGSYINAAFRSSVQDHAYLFMNNEYVLVDYAPGTGYDWVWNLPLLICDGFPSLADTAFAEYGIDCAFGTHERNEAFIFSGNLCALINYAPLTRDSKIIKGPMTIAAMFNFFKGTVFQKGVDAAFESTIKDKAYLFRGDQYALINYGDDNPQLFAIRQIKEGFSSLKGTIFEGGIEAAFASHRTDEAYIFKGDSYALINFAPGTANDYIMGGYRGVKKIKPYWRSLKNILPVKNGGLDLHDHTKPQPDRDHDEL